MLVSRGSFSKIFPSGGFLLERDFFTAVLSLSPSRVTPCQSCCKKWSKEGFPPRFSSLRECACTCTLVRLFEACSDVLVSMGVFCLFIVLVSVPPSYGYLDRDLVTENPRDIILATFTDRR